MTTQQTYRWASLGFFVLMTSAQSHAALQPYAADTNTVYLLHLNEASASSSAANTGTAGKSGITTDSNGNTVTDVFNGSTGLSGFGGAVNLSNSRAIGIDANSSGGFTTGGADQFTLSSLVGTDNTFTLEALVKPNTSNFTAPGEIWCADSNGSLGTRGFQFRINTSEELEYNGLGFGGGNVMITIPSLQANTWYHVALSYTEAGQSAGTGLFTMYWTPANNTFTQAQVLYSWTASAITPNFNSQLVLGNEGRGSMSEGFPGLIDEARISNVARTASDFIFSNAGPAPDSDSDGLPDVWEMTAFSTLAYNGGDDPDGDGFSNISEYEASTAGNDPTSRPARTAALVVPMDDGNPATSEYAYGGSSSINNVAFVRSNLKTVGNQQFAMYYGRHQSDSSYALNNTIWIGRRTVGESQWEIFRHPNFTANNIGDGHDVACFGIDGDGYMHVSWGMHGDAFHYSKSTAPVTGSGSITLGPDTTMTGNENGITYPQFLTLPNGDLLYLFREGGSGNGDTYLNRYRISTDTWKNVHTSAGGSVQEPFIKGKGQSPDNNAYPNMPQLDAEGNLTITWTWRTTPSFQTNHNFAYARSLDGGVTWQKSDGTPYSLPISELGASGTDAAEHILIIPEGSSLINQASMSLDANGYPVIATWWAPEAGSGNHRRQYMVVFRDNSGTWQTRQVSQRTNDGTAQKGDSTVRNLGRPIVVVDSEDRIIVAYRDNFGTNGITIVHSLPAAADPDRNYWLTFDLTTDNLGNYEPDIDWSLWENTGKINFLYQPTNGQGYSAPANTSSRISVLEWDTAAYFSHPHTASLSIAISGSNLTATIPSEPSWRYTLWSSLNLLTWTEEATLNGDGTSLSFVQPISANQEKKFWRVAIAPIPAP